MPPHTTVTGLCRGPQQAYLNLLQSLFDLATKPCSVAFDAYRDESYVNGGEDYLTFSGCTVNIGNGALNTG